MTDAGNARVQSGEPLWQAKPVGIVGMGLIGGSLGLDLMAQGAQVRALVHRPATAERARQRQLATDVSTDPGVLEGCGLVVLALPLDRLLDPAQGLVAALPPEAVITDVGSVKAPVLERWHSRVARFVASHPMAGTAEAGVEAGVAGLFAGRSWGYVGGLGQHPSRFGPFGLASRTPLAGLWLCGDAIYPGEGTAGVSLSALMAARQLLASRGKRLCMAEAKRSKGLG